jgi:hypothetical protein
MWLFNPANIPVYEDCLGKLSSGGAVGWANNTTGVAAGIGDITAASAARDTSLGVWRLTCGGTVTGASVINLAERSIILSSTTNYTLSIRPGVFNILPTGAQDYYFMIGLGNNVDSASMSEHNDGVYFLYDFLISANWIARTANSGVRTSTTSSTPITTTGLSRLKIVITGTTSVEFFIDEVSIGVHTTDVPTGYLTPCMCMVKRAGTATRTVFVDYYAIDIASTGRS